MQRGGTPVESELAEAIDHLYVVFAKYPLPEVIDPLPNCVLPGEEKGLYARPLRELTGADLGHFVNDAGLPWGDVDVLRHFLPRVLELMAHDEWETRHTEGEYLATAIGREHPDWVGWPTEEREALVRFMLALWTVGLAGRFKGWFDLDSFVDAIGSLGVEPRPFVDAWRAARSEMALWYLDDFLADNSPRDKYPRGHWDELIGNEVHVQMISGVLRQPDYVVARRPFMAEMRTWLMEPELGTRMEENADITQRIAIRLLQLRERS